MELQSFLQSGKAPVCITFGSMVNRNAERIDQIVRESLKQTGNRGIVLSGWSKVGNRSSGDLLYLEVAPHDPVTSGEGVPPSVRVTKAQGGRSEMALATV